MFADWIDNPTPERMRLATAFFDFRSINHGFGGACQLRRQLIDKAAGKIHHAREMTANALTKRPPPGFLRQFVAETSGEHSRGRNLKLHGLTPVVDAVRIMALETGIPETNSMARLHKICQQHVLDADFTAAIRIYRRHSATGDAPATAMILRRCLVKLEQKGRSSLVI